MDDSTLGDHFDPRRSCRSGRDQRQPATAEAAFDREAAIRHIQRAGGQVSALAGMVHAGRPFAEVTQQLLAARGSLDSLLVRLVELELEECVRGAAEREEVGGLFRVALGRSGSARSAARRAPLSVARMAEGRGGGN